MTQNSNNNIKRPKLNLPFTDKRVDMGEWAYAHRIGLCTTVIAYLVLAIAFVSGKILIGPKPHTQGFYIELDDVALLEEERDRLLEEVKDREEFDWNSVKNINSNENSLDERIKDDRGTDASQLNEDAARAQAEIEENRRAYEKALSEIEESRSRSKDSSSDQSERRDAKVEGNVTASYSFSNPVRHAQSLVIPAYKCQGGGEIVVSVELDREGRVVTAEVTKGSDRCMREAAIGAARISRFNVDDSAPAKHKGTITYIFIPQ